MGLAKTQGTRQEARPPLRPVLSRALPPCHGGQEPPETMVGRVCPNIMPSFIVGGWGLSDLARLVAIIKREGVPILRFGTPSEVSFPPFLSVTVLHGGAGRGGPCARRGGRQEGAQPVLPSGTRTSRR